MSNPLELDFDLELFTAPAYNQVNFELDADSSENKRFGRISDNTKGRVLTAGYEDGDDTSRFHLWGDRQSSVVHSGQYGWAHTATIVAETPDVGLDTFYTLRVYMYMTDYPTVMRHWLSIFNTGWTRIAGLTITETGIIRLSSTSVNWAILGQLEDPVPLNEWFMLELTVRASQDPSQIWVAARLNGVTFAGGSTANASAQIAPGGFQIESIAAIQNSGSVYYDDIAVNVDADIQWPGQLGYHNRVHVSASATGRVREDHQGNVSQDAGVSVHASGAKNTSGTFTQSIEATTSSQGLVKRSGLVTESVLIESDASIQTQREGVFLREKAPAFFVEEFGRTEAGTWGEGWLSSADTGQTLGVDGDHGWLRTDVSGINQYVSARHTVDTHQSFDMEFTWRFEGRETRLEVMAQGGAPPLGSSVHQFQTFIRLDPLYAFITLRGENGQSTTRYLNWGATGPSVEDVEYRIRFASDGDNVYAKRWPDGSEEPSAWHIIEPLTFAIPPGNNILFRQVTQMYTDDLEHTSYVGDISIRDFIDDDAPGFVHVGVSVSASGKAAEADDAPREGSVTLSIEAGVAAQGSPTVVGIASQAIEVSADSAGSRRHSAEPTNNTTVAVSASGTKFTSHDATQSVETSVSVSSQTDVQAGVSAGTEVSVQAIGLKGFSSSAVRSIDVGVAAVGETHTQSIVDVQTSVEATASGQRHTGGSISRDISIHSSATGFLREHEENAGFVLLTVGVGSTASGRKTLSGAASARIVSAGVTAVGQTGRGSSVVTYMEADVSVLSEIARQASIIKLIEVANTASSATTRAVQASSTIAVQVLLEIKAGGSLTGGRIVVSGREPTSTVQGREPATSTQGARSPVSPISSNRKSFVLTGREPATSINGRRPSK